MQAATVIGLRFITRSMSRIRFARVVLITPMSVSAGRSLPLDFLRLHPAPARRRSGASIALLWTARCRRTLGRRYGMPLSCAPLCISKERSPGRMTQYLRIAKFSRPLLF